MKDIDQTDYSLEEIFAREKPSYSVKQLLYKFHDSLCKYIDSSDAYATTHNIGITYFCGKNKAFLFLDVKPDYLSAKFFTGDKAIQGIGKGMWLNKNDNRGSVPFQIHNNEELKRAIIFSLDAHAIALKTIKKAPN